MITHVNLVEIKVDKCPFCKLELLTKDDGSWCNCCDEPHDENHCSVALVREARDR